VESPVALEETTGPIRQYQHVDQCCRLKWIEPSVCSIADNTVAVLPNMWQSGHAARWPIRPHIGTALARKYVGLGRDPAALPPGTVSLGLALPLRVERTGPARVERVGPF
jgi:hypothetical protein